MLLSYVVPGVRRTVREVILVSVGVFFTIRQALHGDDPSNVAVYGLATFALATRFFAGRALVVGTAFAAIAQRWPPALAELRAPHDWIAYFPFGVLLLTLSSDLVERFDRASRSWPGVANPWVALPEADRRRLFACGYAVAAMAALLVMSAGKPEQMTDLVPAHAAIGALWLVVALLALGRAAALLLVPPLCVAVAAAALGAPSFAPSPGSTVTLGALAALGTALATPYVARLIRRAAA